MQALLSISCWNLLLGGGGVGGRVNEIEKKRVRNLYLEV